MNNTLLAIRDLKFSYGSRLMFDDLCLNLENGVKLGLTGANGSGKTTLLNMIVGLIKPASGDVEIFGKVRRDESDFAEVRRRVGFQFQDPDDQLFCPTVAEDIAFGPMNLGKSRDETLEIVERTLSEIGLCGFEERVTHHLSEGEKKLVSLATAIAMEPEILLLDEPVAGLDDESESRILKVINDLHQAMIIVSHDHDFLSKITSRVLILNNGKLN